MNNLMNVFFMLITMLGYTQALSGTKEINIDPSSEFVNYLYFGFQNGGFLMKSTTLWNMDKPVTEWICKSKEIEYLTNNKLSFESIVDMITLEPIDKPLSFSESECQALTDVLSNRGTYVIIDNNITNYDYKIDHESQTIEVNMDSVPSANNENWEDYSSYAISVNYKEIIEEQGFYYFFISSGESDSGLKSVINYNLINPGEEHLSFDLIPNKFTFLVFLILWVLISIICVFSIIFKKIKKHKFYGFNLLITISIFVLMSQSIAQYARWRLLSRFGKLYSQLETLLLGFEILALSYYLGVIIMIGTGYKIVYPTVRFKSSIKTVIVVFFMIFTILLMRYSNYYLLIFLIVEVVILNLLLKMDIDTNISTIKDILNNQQHNELSPALKEALKYKIKFYAIFKIYMYSYWTLEGSVLSIKPLFELYHEWIFTLMHQIFTLWNMTFLFLIMNNKAKNLFKSIQKDDEEALADEEQPVPLPFNKSKNPKIVGEIIIIKSIGLSQHGLYSVGVETSFRDHKKKIMPRNILKHNDRTLAYKLNESGESIEDIQNISHLSKHEEGKQCILSEENANIGGNNSLNVKIRDYKNKIPQHHDQSGTNQKYNDLENIGDKSGQDDSKKYFRNQIKLQNKLYTKHKNKIYAFASKKMIDFRTQENIASFIELEASCPVRKTPIETSDFPVGMSSTEIPITLNSIEIELPRDF